MLINDLIKTSFAMRIEILSIGYKAGYNMFKAKNTCISQLVNNIIYQCSNDVLYNNALIL